MARGILGRPLLFTMAPDTSVHRVSLCPLLFCLIRLHSSDYRSLSFPSILRAAPGCDDGSSEVPRDNETWCVFLQSRPSACLPTWPPGVRF